MLDDLDLIFDADICEIFCTEKKKITFIQFLDIAKYLANPFEYLKAAAYLGYIKFYDFSTPNSAI